MQLTFDVRQDVKRFLAIGGVSLAMVLANAVPSFAAPTDSDRDGLTNAQEKVTRTSPYKADSDGDRIRDGQENPDKDGLNNLSRSAPAMPRSTPTPTMIGSRTATRTRTKTG